MVQPQVSLENQIIDRLAKEIQEEMDNDIVRQWLVEDGWSEVQLHFTDNKQAVDILLWCEHNVKKNQWKRLNSYFVFRKKKDAEWFILRWL